MTPNELRQLKREHPLMSAWVVLGAGIPLGAGIRMENVLYLSFSGTGAIHEQHAVNDPSIVERVCRQERIPFCCFRP